MSFASVPKIKFSERPDFEGRRWKVYTSTEIFKQCQMMDQSQI